MEASTNIKAMDKLIAYIFNCEFVCYRFTEEYYTHNAPVWVPDFIAKAQWPDNAVRDHIAEQFSVIWNDYGNRMSSILQFYCDVDDRCKRIMLEYIDNNYTGYLSKLER